MILIQPIYRIYQTYKEEYLNIYRLKDIQTYQKY